MTRIFRVAGRDIRDMGAGLRGCEETECQISVTLNSFWGEYKVTNI